jgi:hypothetical protein
MLDMITAHPIAGAVVANIRLAPRPGSVAGGPGAAPAAAPQLEADADTGAPTLEGSADEAVGAA